MAFKRDVEKRCREFFSHCSVEEFDRALAETIAAQGGGAGASDAKCGLEAHCVKRMIACALDRGAREREMCAQALAATRASGTLDAEDFERGFDRVLAEVADLKIDFPDAVAECVTFLARAVADDVVAMLDKLSKSEAKQSGGAEPEVLLVADSRTNSVLVSGDEMERARMSQLIKHLDTPLEQSGNVRVVYLEYAQAKEIAVPSIPALPVLPIL